MPNTEKVSVKLTTSRTDGSRGDLIDVLVAEASRMLLAGQIAAPSKEVMAKIEAYRVDVASVEGEAETSAAEPDADNPELAAAKAELATVTAERDAALGDAAKAVSDVEAVKAELATVAAERDAAKAELTAKADADGVEVAKTDAGEAPKPSKKGAA